LKILFSSNRKLKIVFQVTSLQIELKTLLLKNFLGALILKNLSKDQVLSVASHSWCESLSIASRGNFLKLHCPGDFVPNLFSLIRVIKTCQWKGFTSVV